MTTEPVASKGLRADPTLCPAAQCPVCLHAVRIDAGKIADHGDPRILREGRCSGSRRTTLDAIYHGEAAAASRSTSKSGQPPCASKSPALDRRSRRQLRLWHSRP